MLISLSLRDDNTYFPIGDTERSAKSSLKYLGLIFDCDESVAIDYAVAFSKNVIFSVFAEGFCFFRGFKRTNSNIDFVFLCGWHSDVHKQNDELSFILDYKGETFFDDAGYSVYIPQDIAETLNTEHSHSSIVIDGVPWADKNDPDGRNTISGNMVTEGCVMEAEHYRCHNARMARTVHIRVNSLLLEDFIAPKLGKRSRHRFVLGKDVLVSEIVHHDCGYRILLTKNSLQAALYCISSSCRITEEYIHVVEENQAETKLRKVLDVAVESTEIRRISFFLTFDGTRYEEFLKTVKRNEE
jgi:hypothetical protein